PLEDWVKLLGDPRPAVQRLVIEDLARPRGKAVVLPMLRQVATKDASAVLRRNAVWTLARIDDAGARSLVHFFLWDSDETARQAAIHVTGLWCDRRATPRLLELLQGTSAPNRRAAAEALGRTGDKAAVPALLAAAGSADDRIIEHSITYALIEIGDPQGTAAG